MPCTPMCAQHACRSGYVSANHLPGLYLQDGHSTKVDSALAALVEAF
jgi:hypothetical protein